jgi:hypothetical protein
MFSFSVSIHLLYHNLLCELLYFIYFIILYNMGGGLLQLVAYGAQDIYLTGNPQITFFKVVYRRHTNFSMECIKQVINGQDEIGTTSVNNKGTVTISKTGDLVTSIYVVTDQHTTRGICGDHLVEDVEIEIGGQRIDKQYREWNQIWSELTIPKSKQEGFKYMTGSFNNTLVTGSTSGTNQQSIQYPLNFWFCRNPGLALPLIALQYHDVQLKFTWGSGIYNSSNNENLTRAEESLPSTHLVEVWCDYIYLDTDERRRFSQVSHEYLIEQLQLQKEKNTLKSTFNLNLEHPVKELIWTNPSANPVLTQKGRIVINGHDRFPQQDKEYFQIKQPYQHHTSIPGYNIKEYERPVMLSIPINVGVTTHNNTIAKLACSIGEDANPDEATTIKFDELTTNIPIVGDILYIALGSGDSTDPAGDVDQPTFQTVTAVSAASDPVVTISPGLINTDIPAAFTNLDGVKITIVARHQDPKSNCSQFKKDINVYSFALEPEEHQPSGTCNFSRIESAQLIFSADTYISNIYAVNYNVLRIMSGMAGIAYAS